MCELAVCMSAIYVGLYRIVLALLAISTAFVVLKKFRLCARPASRLIVLMKHLTVAAHIRLVSGNTRLCNFIFLARANKIWRYTGTISEPHTKQ